MTPIAYQLFIDQRRNTPFVITPEKSFYLINGKEVSEDEFNATYPVPLKVKVESEFSKGNNPDKTRAWLQD